MLARQGPLGSSAPNPSPPYSSFPALCSDHNMELGLQWLESQRAVMYDEAFSGFFLRAGGVPTAPAYNEPIHFGDQLFWDFRNESARQYFVASTVATLRDPAVDGTFTE